MNSRVLKRVAWMVLPAGMLSTGQVAVTSGPANTDIDPAALILDAQVEVGGGMLVEAG